MMLKLTKVLLTCGIAIVRILARLAALGGLWQAWRGLAASMLRIERVETREQQGSKLAPYHVKAVLFFHLPNSLSYFDQRL
jgi:hypothetical protein